MRTIILTIAALLLVAAFAIAVMPRADAQGEGITNFLPVVQSPPTRGQDEAQAVAKNEIPPEPDVTPSPLTDEQIAEIDEQMKAWRDEQVEKDRNAPTIYLSGPETAGTVVQMAGKAIQLPPNIYVVSYVVDVYCEADAKDCPQAPIFTLGYTDDPKMVRETDSGMVTLDVSEPRVAVWADGVLHAIDSKSAAKDLADFAWLSAQLGTTPAPVEAVQ